MHIQGKLEFVTLVSMDNFCEVSIDELLEHPIETSTENTTLKPFRTVLI